MELSRAWDILQDGYAGYDPPFAQEVADAFGVTEPVPTFRTDGNEGGKGWGGPAGTVTCGFDLARHIANHRNVTYDQPFIGRGSNHREVLAALKPLVEV